MVKRPVEVSLRLCQSLDVLLSGGQYQVAVANLESSFTFLLRPRCLDSQFLTWLFLVTFWLEAISSSSWCKSACLPVVDGAVLWSQVRLMLLNVDDFAVPFPATEGTPLHAFEGEQPRRLVGLVQPTRQVEYLLVWEWCGGGTGGIKLRRQGCFQSSWTVGGAYQTGTSLAGGPRGNFFVDVVGDDLVKEQLGFTALHIFILVRSEGL